MFMQLFARLKYLFLGLIELFILLVIILSHFQGMDHVLDPVQVHFRRCHFIVLNSFQGFIQNYFFDIVEERYC